MAARGSRVLKPLVAPLSVLLASSLPLGPAQAQEPASTPAPAMSDDEAEKLLAGLLPSCDFEIVPGERAGCVEATSTEADLKQVLGAKQVRYMSVPLGEDMEEKRTVIFPGDGAKYAYIKWADAARRRWPIAVSLESDKLRKGQKSAWQVRPGLALDMTIEEVQRKNGRPFVIDFDPGAPVPATRWRGGLLEDLDHKVNLVFYLPQWRLDAGQSFGSPGDEMPTADKWQDTPSSIRLVRRYRVWHITATFPSNDKQYAEARGREAAAAELKAEVARQILRACSDSEAVAAAAPHRTSANPKVKALAERVAKVRGSTMKSRVAWLASKGQGFQPAACGAKPAAEAAPAR
jgi:hypothetical protein